MKQSYYLVWLFAKAAGWKGIITLLVGLIVNLYFLGVVMRCENATQTVLPSGKVVYWVNEHGRSFEYPMAAIRNTPTFLVIKTIYYFIIVALVLIFLYYLLKMRRLEKVFPLNSFE